MYDPITLSVLHRMQWETDAKEALTKLNVLFDEEQISLADELAPRLQQIKSAAKRCEHYFVERHFIELAQFAAQQIPLDVVFDEADLITPDGWAELEGGILPWLPTHPEDRALELDRLGTLIWFPVTDPKREGRYWQFKFIQPTAPWNNPDYIRKEPGKLMWTDFGIKSGETLGALLERVPTANGWAQIVFALMHLLGQKMTVSHTHRVRTNVANQAKSKNINVDAPRIITLRRVYEERQLKPQGHNKPHEFQWTVRGHWRKQPYKTTGEIRPIFIEAYIKGPTDKPLKISSNIFVARR